MRLPKSEERGIPKSSMVERVRLDLFSLKSKHSLEGTYLFFNKAFQQYFDKKGRPIMEFFEETRCPLCSSKEKVEKTVIDLFRYVQCTYCQSIYTDPVLKEKVLYEMYSSGAYLEYFKKMTEPSQKLRKGTLEKRKLEQISVFFDRPGSVLDVGCGSGSFLKCCEEAGWKVTGVDPSQEAKKMAHEKYKITISESFDALHCAETFDCITFWGVLEHLSQPIKTLKKAVEILSPGGVIAFEVPSADCFLMQYLNKFPFGATRYLEAGRHNLFFSRLAIDNICSQFNLSMRYVETNGLDIQTILFKEFDVETTSTILNLQEVLNENLQGDHYRVFLVKNKSLSGG